MRVSSIDDCRLFQQELDRLQGWCRENKYDLNSGKCKSISFTRGLKRVMFQYVIGDSDFERVDVINDLGVLVDSRMTFVDHFESIVSKSARMLSSRTLTRTRRCMLLLSCQIWSMHRACGRLIKRFIRRQHNFICIASSGLDSASASL
jgi:hypothetical protein